MVLSNVMGKVAKIRRERSDVASFFVMRRAMRKRKRALRRYKKNSHNRAKRSTRSLGGSVKSGRRNHW